MHILPAPVNVAHATGVIEDAIPISKILSDTLSFVLGVAGVLAMVSLTVSGLLYITAQGNETGMKQAKQAMIYSIIGVAVCVTALIIVRTVAGMV